MSPNETLQTAVKIVATICLLGLLCFLPLHQRSVVEIGGSLLLAGKPPSPPAQTVGRSAHIDETDGRRGE
jgi:hypothetical protein